jgi:uncharacterized protein (TIGR03435 family)
MMRVIVITCLAGFAIGQTRPEFEVASIKPSAGGERRSMGMGRSGDFEAKNMPLRALIAQAHGVNTFQIYGAPGWVATEAYDIATKKSLESRDGITAKTDFEAYWNDTKLRLQVLLEERCSLKVHHETKELPVYHLTIAKGGPKLEPSNCVTPDPGAEPLAPGQPRPAYCGNLMVRREGLNSVLTATGVSMSDLVRFLSGTTSRTVIDKTGHADKFSAKLEWTPEERAPRPEDASTEDADTVGPSLFTAIQEQLGLKLESAKGPVDVLVIDRVEKASGN